MILILFKIFDQFMRLNHMLFVVVTTAVVKQGISCLEIKQQNIYGNLFC